MAMLFVVAMTPRVWAADALSAQDVRDVRAIIEAQLNAFAANDAARAFSYATPALQGVFGTPANFMAMVHESYPAIVKPAGVSFFDPEWIDGHALQRVQLTDARGAVWTALYELERQPDRRWRIAGCRIAASAGRVV